MVPLLFVVLLALPAPKSGVSASPCARILSADSPSIFVASRGLELETQRECLVWEASVQPKAEFIPPSARNASTHLVIGPAVQASPSPLPSTGFMGSAQGAQSFGLGLQSLVPAAPPKEPDPHP